MTPQPTIVTVALTAVLDGGWYAKNIINNREKTRKAEAEAREMFSLSQEETKRTRIVAEIARGNLILQKSLNRYKTLSSM